MKEYHVIITSPVEMTINGIRARTGREAIQKAIQNAGFTNIEFVFYQGAPGIKYPKGKRPTGETYREKNTNIFIHAIAWTI